MQRKRADEVDRDRQLELVEWVALGFLGFLVAADGLDRVGDARAVDQHPLLAMRRARLVERRADLLVAGHVDFAEDAADLRRDLLAALDVAVEHGDLRALGGERAGGRFAKARGGAGDDRGDSVQCPCLLLLVIPGPDPEPASFHPPQGQGETRVNPHDNEGAGGGYIRRLPREESQESH